MATPYDERPWLRFYATGVPADVDVPNVPVTRLLDESAGRYPRRAALIFFGRKISYRRLAKLSDRFADALRGLGIHKGDRVAMILPNSPQQTISFYGILRRGAVVVQHNPLYTAAEHHQQLMDSGAKAVVVFEKAYETVAAAATGTAVEHIIVTSLAEYLPAGKRLALHLPIKKAREARAELTAPVPDDPGLLFFRELLRSARSRHRQVPLDPRRDLACLQYTGGTTGRPKGAMLTHFNLVANACQARAWDPDAVDGKEVTLATLPMFHIFGLTLCLTMSALAGATVVLVPKFDVDLVLDAARTSKPTIFPGVPPMYQRIIESPRIRKANLRSIRTCVSGAMKLPRETVDAFRRATGGGQLVQGYGLTESSPVVMANPLDGNARHISVGIPMPSTYARIVREDNPRSAALIGEAGELLVYGPQVFQGYWGQPRETAEVLSRGWLRTGDIAMMSPDGFFTLIDRKKDVIIVDGINVYPSEIEEALLDHPAVLDCAVIGIPDERRGEQVKAYVVPMPGYRADPGEITDFCARRLAPFKVPTVFEYRQELPKNMLGKVLRRVLREDHSGGGEYAPEPSRPAPAARPPATAGPPAERWPAEYPSGRPG
ncbi:MAG TPA: AMP-binding protein [Streptosporangiaceae bacterium]|nr:AMP-binding protein [Streptosporangiaceae bacterium]